MTKGRKMTAPERVALQDALEILFRAFYQTNGLTQSRLYDAIARLLNPEEDSCLNESIPNETWADWGL